MHLLVNEAESHCRRMSQQDSTSCQQGGELIPIFSNLQFDFKDLLDLTFLDPRINTRHEDL